MFPDKEDLTPDGEHYEQVFDKLLSTIIGRNTFNKLKKRHKVSHMSTVSDEAFLLVSLENACDHWKAEWENNEDSSKWPAKKHTSNPASAKQCSAWSADGRKRHNQLLGEVITARLGRDRKLKEDQHLKKWAETINGRKRKRQQVPLEEEVELVIVPCHLPGQTEVDSAGSQASPISDMTEATNTTDV